MSNLSKRLRLLIERLIRERGRRNSAVFACVIVPLCLTGCADNGEFHLVESSANGTAAAKHVELQDGSPEATAVLDALNDPSLTWSTLVEEVGVSELAATSWTEWRAVQPFQVLEEVRTAAGVTPGDISLVAVWAWDNGYLPIETDLLGTWDGVDFTATAAAFTLKLVNEADKRMLDEVVGLDMRAVQSIMDARPVASMTELSSLFWIGPDTMEQLKQFALDFYASDVTDMVSE
jgi:hypothetical protein